MIRRDAVLGTCSRCMKWVVAPTLSDRDTARARTWKEMVTPFAWGISILHFCYSINNLLVADYHSLVLSFTTFLLPIPTLVLHYCYRTTSETIFFVTLLLGLFTVVILPDIKDYGNYDLWTASVVVMDIMLVIHAREAHVNLLRYITLVYIIIKGVEEATRFGLYDIVPSDTFDPPQAMAIDTTVVRLLVRITVFLIDFFLTRHFARGMQIQTLKAMSSVQLAEKVASALVK
eukprot:Sspe_Gene.115656::Locus_103307_Transcript_1_1_Confidence_1.000_Length_746::g.115656::m.115656